MEKSSERVPLLGYYFKLKTFIRFLLAVAKTLLKGPVTKLLEKIEFSQGLATLRATSGK